jgi:hypothetical protein
VGGWTGTITDGMRTFRFRRASEIISAAPRGVCTAVLRRFEEKKEYLTTEDTEDTEAKRQILYCLSSVSSVSSRSLLRPGGESSFFSPSEELPTTGHGLTPISSHQRLEPAERDYARTGRLPFLRRLRQRVSPG